FCHLPGECRCRPAGRSRSADRVRRERFYLQLTLIDELLSFSSVSGIFLSGSSVTWTVWLPSENSTPEKNACLSVFGATPPTVVAPCRPVQRGEARVCGGVCPRPGAGGGLARGAGDGGQDVKPPDPAVALVADRGDGVGAARDAADAAALVGGLKLHRLQVRG